MYSFTRYRQYCNVYIMLLWSFIIYIIYQYIGLFWCCLQWIALAWQAKTKLSLIWQDFTTMLDCLVTNNYKYIPWTLVAVNQHRGTHGIGERGWEEWRGEKYFSRLQEHLLLSKKNFSVPIRGFGRKGTFAVLNSYMFHFPKKLTSTKSKNSIHSNYDSGLKLQNIIFHVMIFI